MEPAAIARWTDQGKTVTYLLATHGEAGMDSMPPPECARVREAEERASAAEVGVNVVEFLDHPDGLIEDGIPLRRDIARAYLDYIGQDAREIVTGIAKGAGEQCGVPYATTFEVLAP